VSQKNFLLKGIRYKRQKKIGLTITKLYYQEINLNKLGEKGNFCAEKLEDGIKWLMYVREHREKER